MSDLDHPAIFPNSLLVDLKRCRILGQQLVGCLDVNTIANTITEGLVHQFSCAFARIWIVEPDRTTLRLVASSGLHTRLDGAFGRVPMGAFKVGKIAQHNISFLSNCLAEEPWVKDQAWAIANQLQGFAGLPLMQGNQTLGVLAVFSQKPMTPEFLEVLQVLSDTLTAALAGALRHEQNESPSSRPRPITIPPLSEQLGSILGGQRLSLIGTERPVSTSVATVLVQAAARLATLDCSYCRLTYDLSTLQLEAMVAGASTDSGHTHRAALQDLGFACNALGGRLSINQGPQTSVMQVQLVLPQVFPTSKLAVTVRCRLPLIQAALTQLASTWGLVVVPEGLADPTIPYLTDMSPSGAAPQVAGGRFSNSPDTALYIVIPAAAPTPQRVIPLPTNAAPEHLKSLIAAAIAGDLPSCDQPPSANPLSEREREILQLLTEGLRDRDIAESLFISERTVKFHLNNALTKLRARTRLEAVYQATIRGFIHPQTTVSASPTAG